MKKISVVIVTYNNIMMLKELLSDLNIQTMPPQEIIVVDNASMDTTQEVLRKEYPKVRNICLKENTGSSGGFFVGIQEAVADSDFILTFDDDVRLEKNTIEELAVGFERVKNMGKVAAVRTVGHKADFSELKMGLFTWRGTFFDTDAVRQIGLPRRDLFIYGEDLEYSLRFIKEGYSFFWIGSSVSHNPRLEGKKIVYILGKKLAYYTDPFRLYYAFRNELWVYLKNGHFFLAFKTFFYALKVSLAIIFLDRVHVSARIGAIMHGLCHGLFGKLGKNEHYTPDIPRSRSTATKSLFIINDFPPVLGGQSSYYFNFCSAFPKGELIILAPKLKGSEAFDRTHKLAVIRRPYLVFIPGLEKICKILLPLIYSLRIIRREKISCIHCGHVLSTGVVGLILRNRVPYIIYTHSADILEYQKYWPIKKLLQRVLNNAATIVCNSQFTLNKLLDLGIERERIQLIYFKIDLSKFDRPLETRSIIDRYDLADKKIILSINRLIERKGNDKMIQAMPVILKEIPDSIYVIGGSGRYESRLREMVRDHHVEKEVIFINDLSNEDVIKLYKICDIFVMVSRTLKQEDTEGFGIALLEANACGKPVIGGRSGGIPEAVQEGYSGLLVDPLNVDEIAKAVVLLLKDKSYASQLGAQGKMRVQEQFDARFYAKDIKELMEGVSCKNK